MSNLTFDFLNQYEHGENSEVPVHSHVIYELVYYSQGCGETVLDGQKYKYSAGNYSILSPGQPHSETHRETTSVWCVGVWVHDSAEKIGTGVFSDRDGQIMSFFERFKFELTNHAPYSKNMLDLIAEELIITHKRLQAPYSETERDLHYIIQHIIQLIENNIAQTIPVRTMAELSGYSYHRFRHIFKEKTGLSPKNYIVHRRLENAKVRLANTNDDISSIAFSYGFCSSSQFSMLFRRSEGLSPSQFRDKHSKI